MPIDEFLIRRPWQPGSTEPDQGADADPSNPPDAESLAFTEAEIAVAHLTPLCIVDGFFYNDVGQLLAPGGTGKTTLILPAAINIALGRSVWGQTVKTRGWTLFVTAEDRRERIAARVREILSNTSLTAEERTIALRAVRVWERQRSRGAGQGVFAPAKHREALPTRDTAAESRGGVAHLSPMPAAVPRRTQCV